MILGQFPAGAYPRLAEITFQYVMQPGYDYGDEFEFGLDLILDGLERASGTRPDAGRCRRGGAPSGVRYRPRSQRVSAPPRG